VKRCDHSDSRSMPAVRGRTTPLSRCLKCNRDFDSHTGLLVRWGDGGYVYASNRLSVP
jgi:hypothetical protein